MLLPKGDEKYYLEFLELYPHSKISRCINDLADKVVIENRMNADDSERPFFWNNVFPVQ